MITKYVQPAPITAAAEQLAALPAGTPLRIAVTDGGLTLTAPGMVPVTLSLPVGCEVTVDEGLAESMADVAGSLADAHSVGEEISASAWFWLASSMLAAGESGVSVTLL